MQQESTRTLSRTTMRLNPDARVVALVLLTSSKSFFSAWSWSQCGEWRAVASARQAARLMH